MNLKKTAIIVCVSAAMISGAITLSMWLTEEKEMEMEVSNPKQEDLLKEQTKVYAEGENIPLYYDDKDMLVLPVRNVAEGLGGTVTWEKESKNVTILYKGKKLVLEAGNTVAKMQGHQITLRQEPQTINGCLYVEASVLSDFFLTEVQWDSMKRQITLKAKGNSIPIVASDMLLGKNKNKEYHVEIPVIIGLNDTSYEKGLNKEIRSEFQTLIDGFMLEDVDSEFFVILENGFISEDFVSLCWKGTKGDQPFFKTLNIDLREQKKIGVEDILTEDGIHELKEQGELSEESIFYITKRKEVAIIDPSKDKSVTILIPADGALLGNHWKPKYQALFPGIM